MTVYNLALGASDGEVRFTVGLDTTNRVASGYDRNTRAVRQQSLDNLIDNAFPIMMKIDVEGFEEEVLRGAQRLLANLCLKVIELESVTPLIETMLTDHKFKRHYYDPFSRRFCNSPTDIQSFNSVFVRDLEFAAERLAAAEPVTVFGRAI